MKGYAPPKLKNEGKEEEFQKALGEFQQALTLFAKHSGLTKRFQEGNKKPQYFFGDFTYIDASLIPFFDQLSIF